MVLSGQMRICAPARTSLVADSKQHRAGLGPFVTIDQPLIFTQREVMQRHFGMRVRTEQRRTFEAYRSIAKRGPFRADGHDADMLHARTRL